jgi:hypothetical protein
VRSLCRISILSIFCGALIAMTDTSVAQTQADLDKATLAANIAEQERKAADSKKAAAIAAADAAAAASKAANDLAKNKAESDKSKADADKAKADADKAAADADKARVDVDKAKSDAGKAAADADKAKADADKAVLESVKAGLPTPPDPAKYKIEKPAAPALGATIGRLTYQQAAKLADKISPKVATAATGSTLVADDAKVRTLMAMGTATKEGLLTAQSGLDGQTRALQDRMKGQPMTAFATGTALAIGSLLENVLAYATILRTQYGFASVSATTNAEATLTALVLGQLAGKLNFVDADGALPQDNSEVAGRLGGLRNAILTARTAISDAARWSKERRDATPAGTTEAEKAASRAANTRAADEVDRLADALGKAVDEAQKLTAALFVVDAQGNTAYDAAQRGEALTKTLTGGGKVMTLTLKVVSSDVDTVATDGLFRGFKVYAGNTTIGRWKLVDSTGKLISAGAEMEEHGPERVKLTGN